MDLDLRLVRYAIAVADELHFGRAAAKLMIAQQTLSAQIAELERRLGATLFVRDRHHVEPTAAGRVFAERGRRLLLEAADLVEEVASNVPAVRIDVVTEGLTPSLIAQYLRRHEPALALEVLQGHGLAATAGRVASGDVDIAFGRVHGLGARLPEQLEHALVRIEPIGVTLPADHELAGHEVVPVKELAEFPLLIHNAVESMEWRDWMEELVSAFGLVVASRFHGHGRASAGAAVLTYRLPAFAPVESSLIEGLVIRPLVEPVPLYPWSAVWRAGRRGGAWARLLDTVQDLSAKEQWLRPPDRRWWMPPPDREDLGGAVRV